MASNGKNEHPGWPYAGEFGCACRFRRGEDFGPVEQIDECGFHCAQREKLSEGHTRRTSE